MGTSSTNKTEGYTVATNTLGTELSAPPSLCSDFGTSPTDYDYARGPQIPYR